MTSAKLYPLSHNKSGNIRPLLEERLSETNPEALFADGFDEAIMGIATQCNKSLVLYDYQKCVEILVERDEMSYEEAVEYMEFNTCSAWMGENTPLFFRQIE